MHNPGKPEELDGVIGSKLARYFSIFLVALMLLIVLASLVNAEKTDYQRDLSEIENAIEQIDETVSGTRKPSGTAFEGVYLLYLRASLTGRRDHFEAAEGAIESAMRSGMAAEDLHVAKAALLLKQHRLPEAKAVIETLPDGFDRSKVVGLIGDIALQEGRYTEAEQAYAKAVRTHRSWDNLARLAYFKSLMGDVAGAEALYDQAQDEITAKDMRAFAWIQLQRGLLDLKHGRHADASAHYRRAEKAYSGYWLVSEYVAELSGAQRKYSEAVSLLAEIVAETPRPELHQAMGDLYALMGNPTKAKHWHNTALAGYRESVAAGEVLYFHHLAAFHADVREDGDGALLWARKDLELRDHFGAHDAAAWALYRTGDYAGALRHVETVLASGVQDARLYFHAAMIYLAAGRADEGKRYLRLAAEINPRYDAFHVHR